MQKTPLVCRTIPPEHYTSISCVTNILYLAYAATNIFKFVHPVHSFTHHFTKVQFHFPVGLLLCLTFKSLCLNDAIACCSFCVSATDCVSDVGPASVIVGNLVQGNRLASAQGRDMGVLEDESDASRKVNKTCVSNKKYSINVV